VSLSPTSLASVVGSAAKAQPTYAEHGAALAGTELPAGYRHDHYEIGLGTGRARFDRAVEGLRTWQAHCVPGVSVYPDDAAIEEGETVLVCLGRGLGLAAPCRIVKVIDSDNRWGFAYGTLPGHPEQGEEAFLVCASPDGSVAFNITAFSRPASRLVKLAGPISRALQHKATEGYLTALRRFVVGSAT
jgi:uncharacterized protein (UPF0548 family)